MRKIELSEEILTELENFFRGFDLKKYNGVNIRPYTYNDMEYSVNNTFKMIRYNIEYKKSIGNVPYYNELISIKEYILKHKL